MEDVVDQSQSDGLEDKVLDSIGINAESDETSSDAKDSSDPLFVQKRLKQQKRTHERELRARDQQIADLYSRMNQLNSKQDQPSSPRNDENISMADQIQQAVSYTLGLKEETERKKQEAEKMQHVNNQYGELQQHLDDTSDKYSDFDDVVRGDAPFTENMRDAALLLPRTGPGSAGEVLYKLGKDKDTLNRISKLHPLEQAKEMVKLSHTLVNSSKQKRDEEPNALSGNMKSMRSNPSTNSSGINDKTPPSEIMRMMREGRW